MSTKEHETYAAIAEQVHELRSKILTADGEDEGREMQTELAALETRAAEALRRESAADTSVPVDRAERELRALEAEVEMRDWLDAAAAERELRTEAAEYTAGALGEVDGVISKALGGRDAVLFPWRLAAAGMPPVEERADAATTMGATVAMPATERGWLRRVFPFPVLSSGFGVMPSSVPAGQAIYRATTAGTAPANVSKGAAADADALTISTNELAPIRMSRGVIYSIEDAARTTGLVPAARADLSGALGNAMEDAAINGSGTAPAVQGILAKLSITAAGTAETFSDYQAIGTPDGVYSRSARDLRLIISPETAADAQSLTPTNDDSVTALDYMRDHFGQVIVTDHLGVSSNTSSAVIVHGSDPGAIVMPVWAAGSITEDPYGEIEKGRVRLQINALWNFRVIRADHIAGLSFKHA